MVLPLRRNDGSGCETPDGRSADDPSGAQWSGEGRVCGIRRPHDRPWTGRHPPARQNRPERFHGLRRLRGGGCGTQLRHAARDAGAVRRPCQDHQHRVAAPRSGCSRRASVEAEEVVAAVERGPIRGGIGTILVAEDNEQGAPHDGGDAGRARLPHDQGAGCRRSAEPLAENGGVDLLFTDVAMPGPVRSPEPARRARSGAPASRCCSPPATPGTRSCRANGSIRASTCCPRPYTADALARRLRQVLAARRCRLLVRRCPGAGPATCAQLLLVEDALVRDNSAELLTGQRHVVSRRATRKRRRTRGAGTASTCR